MKAINLSELQTLLDHYYAAFGTSLTFYDEHFEAIASSHRFSRCCEAIKKHLQRKCIATDNATLESFNERQESTFFYHCHMNFVEIAHVIYLGNKPFAYLIMGPFRDQSSAETIKEMSREFGPEEKIVLSAFESIPVIDQEKFEAIAYLIKDDFDFTKQNRYLDVSENTFINEIHPYIIEHLNEELGVEDLCRHFGLGRKQLYGIFARNTDLSPKKYINSERVKKAISLLTNTDLTLSEIAERVGINEYTYFSKMFKRFCGRTPMYYRGRSPKGESKDAKD